MEIRKKPEKAVLAGVLVAMVFALDTVTPLGYAIWLGYLVSIYMSARCGFPWLLPTLTALSVALTFFEHSLSPPGIDPKVALTNRVIGTLLMVLLAYSMRRKVRTEQARDRLLHEVATTKQELRRLSSRMFQVQEAERRTIGRDLHDEIGQALTALKINLREIRDTALPEPAVAFTFDCLRIVEDLLQRVRNLALDLRPSLLDEAGLAEALRWHASRQSERAGWDLELDLHPLDPRPSPEIEIACFRVAQEALTNIVRHADADRVSLRLFAQDDDIVLMVKDDGVGFEQDMKKNSAESFGLLGMEERLTAVGGTFLLESHPNAGTAIQARLPKRIDKPSVQFSER